MRETTNPNQDGKAGDGKAGYEAYASEGVLTDLKKIRPSGEKARRDGSQNSEGVSHSHSYTITFRDCVLGLILAFEFGIGVGALIAVAILATR